VTVTIAVRSLIGVVTFPESSSARVTNSFSPRRSVREAGAPPNANHVEPARDMIRFGRSVSSRQTTPVHPNNGIQGRKRRGTEALYREMTKDSNQAAVPSFQDTAFCETGFFLQKCKVFVISARDGGRFSGRRSIAPLDSSLRNQLRRSGSQGGERIVNIVGFRAALRALSRALGRLIPTANFSGHAGW